MIVLIRHIGIENLSDGINGEVNLLCLELGSHLGDGCSININEANGRFLGITVGCDNPREDTEKKRANRFLMFLAVRLGKLRGFTSFPYIRFLCGRGDLVFK